MKYRSLGGVVVAGCIAGVVAACAEPLAQGVGQAMAGAGGALAGMGGSLMAGAGAALAAAGHAVAELGGAGGAGGTAHADTGTGTGAAAVPNPRWVLRDASGAPVDAMAYPYMSQAMQALHFGKHADPAPECVGVERLGDKSVRITYRLDTGKVATTCNGTAIGTARADTSGFLFLDAMCSGTPYTQSNAAGWYLIADHPFYAETAEAVQATTYYGGSVGHCSPATGSGTAATLVPVLPVPAPYDALPAAPYTLAVEY